MEREKCLMMREIVDREHLPGEKGHLLPDFVTGTQKIGLLKGSNRRMITSLVMYRWKFPRHHSLIAHLGKTSILHQNIYLKNLHLQVTKGFQVGLVVGVTLILKEKEIALQNTEIEMVTCPKNDHIIKIELKFRSESRHLLVHL
jgi:hypothetical protein